ncbi:MAG: hypothetical protein AAGF59_00580 [Pseudomonadota bacterium]
MMSKKQFSDEELVAYLDNEADFAPIEEITAALKTDVALAKRLDTLRVDTRAIAGSFESLADPGKSAPALPTPGRQGVTVRYVAATAALALLIGFSGGYVAVIGNQPNWKDYVAAYQALYTSSTLDHVQVPLADQQRELDRVAASIGKDIEVVSLTGFPEIEYKRAQILGYRGKALVQLAFLSSVGEPLALCILRSPNGDTDGIELAELEGMSAASWVKDGYEYILIGGKDPSLVSRLASNFRERPI